MKIAGADPDYHRRDLFEAIEREDYPEWELGLCMDRAGKRWVRNGCWVWRERVGRLATSPTPTRTRSGFPSSAQRNSSECSMHRSTRAVPRESGCPERPGERVSQEDEQFLDFAAQDNQAEIQLCILALKRAKGLALKAFARLMVNDHIGIESRLAALANTEDVQLPTGIGAEGQATLAKVEKREGEEFVREFLKAQIEDHGHDLDTFERLRSTTRDEGAHQFAGETPPILQQHHQLARAVQAAMVQGATT